MKLESVWEYLVAHFSPYTILLLVIICGLGFLLKQSMQINRSVNHRSSGEKSLLQLALENNRLMMETHKLANRNSGQLQVIEGRMKRVEKSLKRHIQQHSEMNTKNQSPQKPVSDS